MHYLIIFLFAIVFIFSLDPELLFFGDVLYLPLVYNDLFEISLSGWHFTPAPYFFPDMAFYFIISFFSELFFSHWFPVAQYIVMICQIMAFYILSERLVSGILKNTYHKMFFLITWLITLTAYFIFEPLSAIFLPSMHSGAYLILLLILTFPGRTIYFVLIFLLAVLATLSDRIFVMYYYVPLVFIYLMQFGWFNDCETREGKIRRWHLTQLFKYSTAGVFSGYVLYQILRNYVAISATARVPISYSFTELISDATEMFFQAPLFYSVFLSLILIGGYRLYCSFRSRNYAAGVLFLALPISLIGTVLYGVYIDSYGFRFFAITFLLPFLTGTVYTLQRTILWLSTAIFKGSVRLNLTGQIEKLYIKIPLMIAGIISILLLLVLYQKNERNELLYYPEDVACLDGHADKIPSRYGIADFWNSRRYILFSRYQLMPLPFQYLTLLPEYTIANRNWFKEHEYGFVITNGFGENLIRERFPEPEQRIECNDRIIYIFQESLSEW